MKKSHLFPGGVFVYPGWTMWISRGETHIGRERIILKLTHHFQDQWEWEMVIRENHLNIFSTFEKHPKTRWIGRENHIGTFLKSSSIHQRFFRFFPRKHKILKKGAPKKPPSYTKKKQQGKSHLKNRWLEDDPLRRLPFLGFGFKFQGFAVSSPSTLFWPSTLDNWGCSGCMSLRVSGGEPRWNDLCHRGGWGNK